MIKQLCRIYRQKYRFSILLFLGAVAFIFAITFNSAAHAKLFDGPVDRLPLEQRVALRDGEVIFLGNGGEYTCRLLVTSSLENAWQVLTDYENFAEFLPGVESTQLIDDKGDRKVFAQVNKIKALLFNIESRIEIANIETYPQEIAFEAIKGEDIEYLKGQWILEPVSPYPSAPPDKVLLTHQVKVKPANTISDGIFYSIYEDRLQETMTAIGLETEQRYSQISKE